MKLTVPDDLIGEYNIVVLAFTQYQQYDVDSWIPHLGKIEEKYPNIRYYEFPTVRRGNLLFRNWLDQVMRWGIPDKFVRSRTITLYTDVEKLLDHIHLTSTRTIYTLILNKQGEIIWQTEGKYNEGKFSELEKFLEQLHQ